jgi:hypothetical protein
MHVAHEYVDKNKEDTYLNYELFYESLGRHEDRLKNLYFIYAVVLRAVNRAEPILRAYSYDTGLDKVQDKLAPEIMDEFLNMT